MRAFSSAGPRFSQQTGVGVTRVQLHTAALRAPTPAPTGAIERLVIILRAESLLTVFPGREGSSGSVLSEIQKYLGVQASTSLPCIRHAVELIRALACTVANQLDRPHVGILIVHNTCPCAAA